MIGRWKIAALAYLMAAPVALSAQDRSGSGGTSELRKLAEVPFGVGERLQYRVKFGPLEVGEARMEVAGIDTVAGHPTYHMLFTMAGGTFFYKMDDKQESWLDVYRLASRRYLQDLHQGSYERLWVWEFDLEKRTFQRSDGVSDSIPADALDEAAFIYFVRSVTLEVGETYEWNRYYLFDRNPVIVQVLRRETVKVPAGEFDTIVVRPIIKAGGIYSEDGEAGVFITDDEWRIPVLLKSKLKVGTLSMEMTEYERGVRLTPEMLGMAN